MNGTRDIIQLRNKINETDKKPSHHVDASLLVTKMFGNRKEYPLSARYKNPTSSTSRPTNNSPTMPVKFDQPVKLTTILSNPQTSGNATQDLNKAEDLSQLISYKLVSGVKKPPAPDKDPDVNIYAIQPKAEPATDTMDALSNVERCITQMEAKAIQQKNIQKFLELCKSIKPDAKADPKDASGDSLAQEPAALQPPLKSFNEVEDLLKPGVSDMEAEYAETFDRSSKTRSSAGGAERAERAAKVAKPLSRAASDAQEHKGVPERVAKAKPRYTRNASQVYTHGVSGGSRRVVA